MKLDAFDRLPNLVQSLPTPTHPDTVHRYEQDDLWAIRCALAARRTLLVRGEPGTGKSQLAKAAAATLGWPFVELVIDCHTSCQDLLFRFDAVERLAEAQVQAALGAQAKNREKTVRERLDPARFIAPGPLWWALNWNSVKSMCGIVPALPEVPITGKGRGSSSVPGKDIGVVVLIDEIDKADSDVPNGLLEVLGNGYFQVPPLWGRSAEQGETTYRISKDPDQAFPLIVVTTNEERELPAAFRRRCVEYHLPFPEPEILKQRAKAHFNSLSDSLIDRVVALILDTRKQRNEDELKPGQAELMDLLRTVQEVAGKRQQKPEEVLALVQEYHLHGQGRRSARR